MIVPLTLQDIKLVSEDIGKLFYSELELPGGFKIDVFIHNWQMLIANNIGVMWKLVLEGKPVGFLGGVLMPDVNNGELVATEMFWYVHPAHRKSLWSIKLFLTFEKWAKDIGAKRIVMAHLMNEDGHKLGKFYLRKGFKPVETHYSKTL
jgi:GNAT superfamily N-acetyltransferase